MNQPLLSVRRLCKSWGDARVVDDVSFDIRRGEVVSLIGPNGAGKSTVFGMITRLIERDSGEVLLEGRDILERPGRELARRMAVLTQTTASGMRITVRELVSFGRFPHSGTNLGPEDRAAVDRAIETMDLSDFADRFIDEISGGQRQRAWIALALAQDTDLVFLDEPTNNLDVLHATRLMRLVRRLCDETGRTFVLVLHELNLASFHSDRILAFRDGRLVSAGSPKEVVTPENLHAIYGVDFEIREAEGRPLTLYH